MHVCTAEAISVDGLFVNQVAFSIHAIFEAIFFVVAVFETTVGLTPQLTGGLSIGGGGSFYLIHDVDRVGLNALVPPGFGMRRGRMLIFRMGILKSALSQMNSSRSGIACFCCHHRCITLRSLYSLFVHRPWLGSRQMASSV